VEGHFLASTRIDMTIEAVDGRVQLAAKEPFRERRIPFEDGVLFLSPVEFLRLPLPECQRIGIGLLVELRLRVRDSGKLCGRFEPALFVQKRV
jgi:hypothetical protein